MKALTPPRLLVATAAACFVFPSCQKNTEAKADAEWWRLETERVEVANQIELFELRLSKQKAGDEGIEALQKEVEAGNASRRELAMERDGLQREVENLEEAAKLAKLDWMRANRVAATGREFESFTGTRGRTYENAVITRVTDVGVEFRHATGTARLAAADLTPAQRELFGLDAAIAGEAIRQEKEAALAYGSWVDGQVAVAEAAKRKEGERVALAAAASKAEARVTPVAAVASVDVAPRSRLNDPPRSFGRVGYSSSYYRPYHRSYTSYYRPYSYTRYRPSASVIYDPCTGGAPARVNATRSYRTPAKAWYPTMWNR